MQHPTGGCPHPIRVEMHVTHNVASASRGPVVTIKPFEPTGRRASKLRTSNGTLWSASVPDRRPVENGRAGEIGKYGSQAAKPDTDLPAARRSGGRVVDFAQRPPAGRQNLCGLARSRKYRRLGFQ